MRDADEHDLPLEIDPPTLEAFVAIAGNDGWASELVQTAAWHHIDTAPAHAGAVLVNDGRASCGVCGWAMSARTSDLGEERSARFGLFVLGWIGMITGVATTEAT